MVDMVCQASFFKNNCVSSKMTHEDPTGMPFLTHFSLKSPPSCIKFQACSKRCHFFCAEIALKLQGPHGYQPRAEELPY